MRISDRSSDVRSTDMKVAAEFVEQRAKAVMSEKRFQRLGRNALQLQIVERFGKGYVAFQLDQLARQPCIVGVRDQIFAQLGFLDIGCGGKHGFDIAIGTDQLRRRRSEEHTSELQSLMRISYAVFCLKTKKE